MTCSKPSLWLSKQICSLLLFHLSASADPDTSPVLKMEFVGSWKSQIKEVTVSQRVIIDCNYLAINMLVTLQKREHYMNMCITNSPSSILYEGCGQGGVHTPVPTVLGKQS